MSLSGAIACIPFLSSVLTRTFTEGSRKRHVGTPLTFPVVKTSELTYFKSDPRHIFQGFHTRSARHCLVERARLTVRLETLMILQSGRSLSSRGKRLLGQDISTFGIQVDYAKYARLHVDQIPVVDVGRMGQVVVV